MTLPVNLSLSYHLTLWTDVTACALCLCMIYLMRRSHRFAARTGKNFAVRFIILPSYEPCLWALVGAYVVQVLLLAVPGPYPSVPLWFSGAAYQSQDSGEQQMMMASTLYFFYWLAFEIMAEGFGIMLLHRYPSKRAFLSTLRYAVLYGSLASALTTLGFNWAQLGVSNNVQLVLDSLFLTLPCILYVFLLALGLLAGRRSVLPYVCFSLTWRLTVFACVNTGVYQTILSVILNTARSILLPVAMYATLVLDTQHWKEVAGRAVRKLHAVAVVVAEDGKGGGNRAVEGSGTGVAGGRRGGGRRRGAPSVPGAIEDAVPPALLGGAPVKASNAATVAVAGGAKPTGPASASLGAPGVAGSSAHGATKPGSALSGSEAGTGGTAPAGTPSRGHRTKVRTLVTLSPTGDMRPLLKPSTRSGMPAPTYLSFEGEGAGGAAAAAATTSEIGSRAGGDAATVTRTTLLSMNDESTAGGSSVGARGGGAPTTYHSALGGPLTRSSVTWATSSIPTTTSRLLGSSPAASGAAGTVPSSAIDDTHALLTESSRASASTPLLSGGDEQEGYADAFPAGPPQPPLPGASESTEMAAAASLRSYSALAAAAASRNAAAARKTSRASASWMGSLARAVGAMFGGGGGGSSGAGSKKDAETGGEGRRGRDTRRARRGGGSSAPSRKQSSGAYFRADSDDSSSLFTGSTQSSFSTATPRSLSPGSSASRSRRASRARASRRSSVYDYEYAAGSGDEDEDRGDSGTEEEVASGRKRRRSGGGSNYEDAGTDADTEVGDEEEEEEEGGAGTATAAALPGAQAKGADRRPSGAGASAGGSDRQRQTSYDEEEEEDPGAAPANLDFTPIGEFYATGRGGREGGGGRGRPAPGQARIHALAVDRVRAFRSANESYLVDFAFLEIGRRVDSGGTACVYRGRYRGVAVAIKEFQVDRIDDRVIAFFHNENATSAAFRHPAIVKYYGLCVSPPHVSLVFEYCERGSLYNVIERMREEKLAYARAYGPQYLPYFGVRYCRGRQLQRFTPPQPGAAPAAQWNALAARPLPPGAPPPPDLSWHRKLRMMLDGAAALAYIHSFKPPYVHRDVKSQNFLVSRNYHLKLADFGESRVRSATVPMTGEIGTPNWMAPEVFRSDPFYGEPADVYSFGMVMWEIVALEHPFLEVTPFVIARMVVDEGVRPEIPLHTPYALAALIEACWDPLPAARPSASELFRRVARMLDEVSQ